jgi:excisionase family DNA binding protein
MKGRKKFEELENELGTEKQILTMAEAVMFTGLTRSTLYRLTSEKRIRHYKPGGKLIIFRRKDLEDFMFSNPIEVK